MQGRAVAAHPSVVRCHQRVCALGEAFFQVGGVGADDPIAPPQRAVGERRGIIADDLGDFTADETTGEHGKGEKLANRPSLRPSCECHSSQGERLCPRLVNGRCNFRVDGVAGEACDGTKASGETAPGNLRNCFHRSTFAFPRTPGSACKGFTVETKLVDGHIDCPQRSGLSDFR